MSDSRSYDTILNDVVERASKLDLSSDEATTAMKNLKTFSESLPPTQPETDTKPEPTTVLGKLKSGVSGVWDNETTRVFIKAGGAFAGVALVAWTTIHRDHVVTREALSQANQRNS